MTVGVRIGGSHRRAGRAAPCSVTRRLAAGLGHAALAAALAAGCAPGAFPVADGAIARPLDVIWVASEMAVVTEMLRLAALQPGDVLYDLGCGDGDIVITAARRHGVPGVGVDLDPARIRQARVNAARAGVTDRVRFVVGDLFETDLREATVVTLYLGQEVNLRVRPKLLRELRPGARIVSHDYDLGDWAPDATGEVTLANRVHRVYLWRVPPPVERPGALSWSRERVPPSGQWR